MLADGWSGRTLVKARASSMRRLLVVDNEHAHCLAVRRAASGLGYVTDVAPTLEAAAARLAARCYDAVVLDLALAEADGLFLLQALRRIAMQAAIVLVSHLDDRLRTASFWLASALGLRVAGTLSKPVVPAALLTVLDNTAAAPLSPAQVLRRRVTTDDLEAALRKHQIVAAYQPQVRLADGRVTGAEALARWPHAKGEIPPDLFIPLAERSGLIVPLTFSILRQAMEACRRWRGVHPDCTVAVNISPLVLADPGLPESIERLLRDTGLGPGALVAEITESTGIGHPLVAGDVLRRLQRKGVGLSIDDFGTGQSSLATLHRLPYGELKMDRSFVTHCDTDPQATKIVRGILSMARELGLQVVAEGIETKSVERLLREAGCDVGQGWWYARAMREADLLHWMAERQFAAA